jgi:hypothetical protein
MNARTSCSHLLQIDSLGPLGQGRSGVSFWLGKYDSHSQHGAWDRDTDTGLRGRGW